MDKELPRFIKINPKFNLKNPSLEILSKKEEANDIPDIQVQPICINCKKLLRFQTKIIVEQDHYCVGCFAMLLPQCENYQIIGNSDYQIIGGGWPARDQLLLLTAIERFGFGNWNAVQQYMSYLGANYFTDQIQNHYDKFYGKSLQQIQDFLSVSTSKKVLNQSKKNNQHVERAGKCLQKTTCLSFCRQNQMEQQEIPCYNSKRGQFEIEYKQNLEKYIADLQFRDNDSEKEIQLKFKILQTYNLGLQDRIRKHNFILEHKLLDENFQAQQNRYLQDNPQAKKAHVLLTDIMSTVSLQQYMQLRKSLQFCFKIQSIIDSLRFVRSSGNQTSMRLLGKLDKVTNNETSQMGKPRKRVHRNPQDTQKQQEKIILKKLNLSKEQLKQLINEASEKNDTVFYNGIKITPINNLVSDD